MNQLTTHLVVKAQSLVNSRIAREETGATAVEYGLIVGLIAVAVVGVLAVLGPHIADMFSSINSKLPVTTTGSGN